MWVLKWNIRNISPWYTNDSCLLDVIADLRSPLLGKSCGQTLLLRRAPGMWISVVQKLLNIPLTSTALTHGCLPTKVHTICLLPCSTCWNEENRSSRLDSRPIKGKDFDFPPKLRFLRIFSGVRISFDFRHVRPSVLSCKSTRFPLDGLPLNVILDTCTGWGRNN